MRDIVVDKETGETIEYRGKEYSSDCLGVHKLCHGFIHITRVSAKFNALQCRSCGLRKLFPATIDLTVFDKEKVWWELSEYFLGSKIMGSFI